MTNKKEVAQAIWNTYVDGYSKALMTPVEQFDTYLDPYSKKIISDILRVVINQLQQSPGVVMCYDILELADELENL
jgi:hypothetical protein